MNSALVVLLIIISILLTGCSKNGDRNISVKYTFNNPVFDGADPWFTLKDGCYYYCSSYGNAISISKSEYLTRKGDPVRVWKAPAEGWNRSCVWAPELHFIDGRWYIYYAAGESGPPYIHQKTGVLQSDTDDPFSKYNDMGMVYTGDNPDMKTDNKWAIDMTVFSWKNKLYAIWSGWKETALTDKTPQHLYIAEMSDPLTIKSPRIKLSSPEERWETGGPLDLQEGPAILIHNDNLFILYSCRESWTTDYRLGLLRLKDNSGSLLDPSNWEKSGPAFQGPFGVGHCSFVKSPDGREDWIAYHSKKSSEEGWRRDVRLQAFRWDKNGYPLFGEPVVPGKEIKRPSGEYRLEKRSGKNDRRKP